MMKVLIVRLSSMGDLIHTLPALTDSVNALPGLAFHWAVDEAFAEVPKLHSSVTKIVQSAHRRWSRTLLRSFYQGEWREYLRQLRQENYDMVIDPQASLKSALLTRLAKTQVRVGHDKETVRERYAHLAYNQTHPITRKQHAVDRARQLFSYALDYPLPETPADYGLSAKQLPCPISLSKPSVVFIHATTWESKHWPEYHWQALGKILNEQGYEVLLPWGNKAEHQRAERIAKKIEQVRVLPRLSITEIAGVLQQANAWVGVDTGLSHLAAALNMPGVSIFGPTLPAWNAPIGEKHHSLTMQLPCMPCYARKCHYHGKHQDIPECLKQTQPQLIADFLLDKIQPADKTVDADKGEAIIS